MAEFADILHEETASPEYQRFLALNIQVPKGEGKYGYERVTICCSLRDLAHDLSLVLPSYATKPLITAHKKHTMAYRHSHHELPSPNPKRDPYIVVCSCGESQCEHAQFAIGHFQRVMAFAQNAGAVAQHLKASTEIAVEAQRQRATLEQRLEQLRVERDQMVEDLELAQMDAAEADHLRETLRNKDEELELLSLELLEKGEEIRHHVREAEIARANLDAMSKEWSGGWRSNVMARANSMTIEVPSVIRAHFMPEPADVDPVDKFQVNVSADHHRVPNTHSILRQLAQLEFVRELGIGYRHPVKFGKVQILPEVDTVEVLVPHNGEADIIRVLTTATTKPQQMLAAHLIAARFDLEVKF